MRRVRMLALTAMALFALGAFAATSIASAEDANSPSILVLEGKGTELKSTLKGGASSLSTLAGKALTGTAVEAKLENCEKLEGSEKDITLCKNQVIDFTGVTQGGVNCRSENAKSEKDAIGTVLALLDLHIAAEENAAKELQPLLLIKVLGQTSGEEELTINCGGVKNKVKGVIPCLLLTGLVMTKKIEVLCKQSATTHDQETGKCEKLCELLEKNPFLSNLGAGFEDAGMSIHVEGEFNKEVFIDD